MDIGRGLDWTTVVNNADAADRRTRGGRTDDPAAAGKRNRLELARTDVKNRIRQAAPGPYREMLEASLRAIEEELRDATR